MSIPDISVIMSAFNEEAYISMAIESILNQTFGNFEFIIIDDCSTDSTPEIIRRYADPRVVRVRNEQNTGLTPNLNKGLRLARAPLIARMDANDVSEPTRFEKQVRILRSEPDIDLVWTQMTYITPEGHVVCRKKDTSPERAVELLRNCDDNFPVGRNHINHTTVMFRKATVMQAGGYDESYRWGQDGNLWCRLVKRGARFRRIDEDLVKFSLLPQGVTAGRSGISNSNLQEYYSNTCLRNGDIHQAVVFMKRMPPGIRKVRQAIRVASRIVLPGSER